MERLTYRDQDGMAMMKERGGWKSGGIAKLAAYEDIGLTPDEIIRAINESREVLHHTYGPFHQKIAAWMNAEQQGRLVMLPFPIGSNFQIKRRGKTTCPEELSHFTNLRPALVARGNVSPGRESLQFFNFDFFVEDVESGGIVLEGGGES